jgi:divalent metal cation (Fe/Co/Zn/Cd) transporter
MTRGRESEKTPADPFFLPKSGVSCSNPNVARVRTMARMLERHNRQALLLSYFTVAYNILEEIMSVVFALLAGSAALLGFGVDSFVESLSGLVMVWRFRAGEHREQTAIRLVGFALLMLAVYVAYESATQLYFGERPEASPVGIIIALVSLVVMPALFVLKRRTARAVNSRSLLADATQTLGCILLSVALLIGLGLNYLLGWWQADPIAGLVIAGFLAREGYRALKEHELCACG